MKITPALNAGEHWYVRLPGQRNVFEAEIISSTASTVLLKIFDDDNSIMICFGILPISIQARYALDDIGWIEKIEAGDE